MSRALSLGAAALLAALGTATAQDAEALIGQLAGLSESAGAEEFLARPALMELAARVDGAVPALEKALRESAVPSVRASALYVLAANGWPQNEIRPFLEDPHPLVQAVAAQAHSSSRAMELMTRGPAAEVAARLTLRLRGNALDWLPEAYARRRIARSLDLLREGPAFVQPPAWPTPSDTAFGPSTSTAYHILSRELQHGRRAHEWMEPVLARLRTETDDASGRVGVLWALAGHVLVHQEPDGAPSAASCPHRAAHLEEIYASAERWAWKTSEPYALDALMSVLLDEVRLGFDPARALLVRLAAEHPSPEARDQAAHQLKELADWIRTEDYLKAWKALQARRPTPAPPTARPTSPKDAMPVPPRPAGEAPTPDAKRIRWEPWAILAAIVAALLLARRRRSKA